MTGANATRSRRCSWCRSVREVATCCVAILIELGIIACGPAPHHVATSPPREGAVHAGPRAALVAVIVMENQSPAQVRDLPYMRSLESEGVFLDNYQAVAHPSLPNYLALTSGSTWGIQDDNYHLLPDGPDLGHELTAAHVPWHAFMESMSGGCLHSPYPYAVKHNPFAYYGGRCPPQVVPLDLLEPDLHGSDAPRFSWITPNLCHDDHDCAPSVGDRWLSGVVPTLLAVPGYRHHGLIAIVWDEGSNSSDHTAALLLSPDLRAHQSNVRYDDYSVLAAVEDRLGVRRLGKAIPADPFGALLG